MTKLTKPVHRITNKKIGKRHVVVTLGPGTDKRDDMIGLRLLGLRVQYIVTISDLYRIAAVWHGQKESTAKKAARKAGIPWRKARKEFLRDNSIR